MRLSIVVNMYNTAAFLHKCMDSLLQQDIPGDSYEIILVDDGSTDNSLELAYEYANQSRSHIDWPTIKICAHSNKGLAAARNTGVDAAIGEYLCFVDPDDYIEKNSLALLLQQMDEEHLDVLRFNYQKVDEDGNWLPDSAMETKFDYTSKIMSGVEFIAERLTTTCYVWAYIYRLGVIRENNIRFVEGCYFDDTPWLPQVLQKVQRVNCTNVRHLYYLQRIGSLVHTTNRESVMRKVRGQLDLIQMMSVQMKTANREVEVWYRKMLAHISISLLTSVALYDYVKRYDYLRLIKPFFPLCSNGLGKNNKKIRVLNFCPSLFMWLIYVKNKRCV